uniref:CDP-glycerol glycerophosphotransferase family protein n=1 Tax=Anaerobutyricum hallii TaxID=39488 RepID=UPI003FED741C
MKKNQITLIEKLNTGGTGSLFEIKNECEKRGLPFHFNIITHADYEVSLRNLGGLLKLFTIKAFRMATSSHIFLNDNFLPLGYMKLSDETKVVQLWHGMGSFKKFGGSSETNPEVLKELKAATKNTDHILASSENIRDNYAEAFMAPKEKVICIGCPQVDYFFREHDIAAWKEELSERYPEMKGKKLVLYAPTFRGEEEHDKKLLEAFDFDAFQKELGKDYFLMVRLHPQIQSAKVPDTVANMTDYPNVRKLLCMTDILIADYSSIAVEY